MVNATQPRAHRAANETHSKKPKLWRSPRVLPPCEICGTRTGGVRRASDATPARYRIKTERGFRVVCKECRAEAAVADDRLRRKAGSGSFVQGESDPHGEAIRRMKGLDDRARAVRAETLIASALPIAGPAGFRLNDLTPRAVSAVLRAGGFAGACWEGEGDDEDEDEGDERPPL